MSDESMIFCIESTNRLVILTYLVEENKVLVEARPPISPANIIWAFTKSWPVQVIRDEIDLSQNPWLVFSTTKPWNFIKNKHSRRELIAGEFSISMTPRCLFISCFREGSAPATLTHYINDTQNPIVVGNLPLNLEFWPTSDPILIYNGLK